jgi:hypothetical protein
MVLDPWMSFDGVRAVGTKMNDFANLKPAENAMFRASLELPATITTDRVSEDSPE